MYKDRFYSNFNHVSNSHYTIAHCKQQIFMSNYSYQVCIIHLVGSGRLLYSMCNITYLPWWITVISLGWKHSYLPWSHLMLYTGKYLPPFYFCPFCAHLQMVNLRPCKFVLLSNLNIPQSRLNEFKSGRNSLKERTPKSLFSIRFISDSVTEFITGNLHWFIRI